MARYKGPKDKLSRREGFDLFGKGGKLTRLNIPPGVHGQRRARPSSQYGKQLREKQKVKRLYGVLERQFANYMKEALGDKGNTADSLFRRLETRLDNVVYRLGFAATRPQARQMVSHKHILVDGKKLNIPSYQLSEGQTVVLSAGTANIPKVKELLEKKDVTIPTWLERRATAGKVVRLPSREDVTEPIEEQDIIEFYSR